MKRTSPFQTLTQAMILFVASMFSVAASAQSAGDSVVNLGWFHLDTHDHSQPLTRTQPTSGTIANSGAAVSSADTLGLAYSYFFTDNFALTLDAGVPPKFNLSGTGSLAPFGHLGSAKQWSPAVVAKWYFGDADAKFRPFIGLGATRVWYTGIKLSPSLQNYLTSGAGTASADLSSSWAPVANVGMVYNLDKRWSIGFSLSYIPLETDAELTGRVGNTVVSRAHTTIELDPYVSFLSIGYKF